MSTIIEGEFTEVEEIVAEEQERVMPFETEQHAALIGFLVALLEMPTTKNKKQVKKLRKTLTKLVERSIGSKQSAELIKNNVATTIQLVNGIRHTQNISRKDRLKLFQATSDQFQAYVDTGLNSLYGTN